MDLKNHLRFLTCERSLGFAAMLCLLTIGTLQSTHAQKLGNLDREHCREMLSTIKADIERYYYDPRFHGIDLNARFGEADEKIERATSFGQIFGIIAQVLIELNDSHTFFMPPRRASRTEYGWRMQMIGNKCYVVTVTPGSDAEAKGLKPGDEIYSVNGYEPTRENLWKMLYYFYHLRPQPGIRVVVQDTNGQRQLDVKAKVIIGQNLKLFGADTEDQIREAQTEARLHRHRHYEIGDDLIIWKMPQFDLSNQIDGMLNKVRKRKAVILDLRGNPGGAASTLHNLINFFFDHDVKIGDVKTRNRTNRWVVKSSDGRSFKGKLIVLVDSDSGSAAEVFARVIQLEKRGIVIGDRTAGAVMGSSHHEHMVGGNVVTFYSVSITQTDLTMTDGKSLEHVGVTPDELLLPTAADITAKRDPVLSRAAVLIGVKLDPEKASALFPIEWRK